MKRYLLLTTALLMLVPDIAAAQSGDRHGGDRGGGGPGGAPPQAGRPGGGNGAQPGRPGGGGHMTRPTPQPSRPSPQPSRPQPGRPGGPGGGHNPPPRPQPGRPTPSRPQPSRPTPSRPRPPEHRPGAGRPPNFRPIHGRPYRYPHGYAYRRWSIGLLLPSLFLSSSYYYDDYGPLGVGAPPPGYRWVRYGPDLLMVQMRTGRIADVIYGAFY